MTTNGTTTHDPLTYRRLSTACFLFAGIVLFVGSLADYLYVGIVAYVVLAIAGFAVRHTANATLFDERDRRLHDRASGSAIRIISHTGIILIPAVVGLAVAEYITLSPEWFGFMMAFPALMGVYSAAYGYHRYR